MRSRLSLWLQAVRAPFYTGSLIPVILGAAIAFAQGKRIPWLLLPLVILASILVHTGTNLANDYFDFKKGVDKKGTFGSSRVLVDGLMPPEKILTATYIAFASGFALSLPLIALRGAPLLALGVIGILAGYLYSGGPQGLKYIGLGELIVFLFMGPLLVIGSFFALTGSYNSSLFYISLPIGFLITAVLFANNLRDIKYDKQAKVVTLVGKLGFSKAKPIYVALVFSAYISVLIMVFAHILPLLSLLTILTLPLALNNVKTILGCEENNTAKISSMDISTAKLHFSFGCLLILSLFAQKLLSHPIR